MCRDDGFVDAINMFHQIFYLCSIFSRQTIAGSVGDIHNGGTCLDDGFYDTCQIFIVGTTCVFGIELYIIDITASIFHCSDGALYDFFAVAVKLVFDV